MFHIILYFDKFPVESYIFSYISVLESYRGMLSPY